MSDFSLAWPVRGYWCWFKRAFHMASLHDLAAMRFVPASQPGIGPRWALCGGRSSLHSCLQHGMHFDEIGKGKGKRRDHDPLKCVSVFLGRREGGLGRGHSRSEACNTVSESLACELASETLRLRYLRFFDQWRRECALNSRA